jgi:putative SOS response-associated peptidase YedK
MTRDDLEALLPVDVVDAPDLPRRWNVAPTQPLYAVRERSDGKRALEAMRWGLVPRWADDARIGARLINARAETLAQRPAFRHLIGRHQALLPVSGFYEWRRQGTTRQPFYFRRRDGYPMVLAGLWDVWSDEAGQHVQTCTIITTAANSTMAPVHHRMPVVLPERSWPAWLSPRAAPTAHGAAALAPAPPDLLEAYPVGQAVNSAVNDGPGLVQPVTEQAPRLWS